MKKIYIHGKDNIGWSTDDDYYHVYNSLNELKLPITGNFFNAKIVHSIWYNRLLSWKTIFLKSKYIIATLTNDVYDNNGAFDNLKNIVDLWIAANLKQIEFLKQQRVKYEYQPFYVDERIFRPLNKNKSEIAKLLNIPHEIIMNKFIISSVQRDSLGDDLSKPKWQKNPDMLVQIILNYKKKYNDLLVILAGPRRHYLKNEFKKNNIPFFFVGHETEEDDIKINILDKLKVNLIYNLSDLYIITSLSEGGPKAILEASFACCPLISTHVGMADDVLTADYLFNNYEQALNHIERIKTEGKLSQNKISEDRKFLLDSFGYAKYLSRWENIYIKINKGMNGNSPKCFL